MPALRGSLTYARFFVDGVENPNEAYWNIAAWLVSHGYGDEDIFKLTSRNGLRVLSESMG